MNTILQNPLPFSLTLLLMLLVARVFGEIMERLKHPAIIGEIIAGIVLGPSLLNMVQSTGEIKVISDLGVFLLIILAGIDVKFEDVRKSVSGKSGWIAVMGFVIPMLSGLIIGWILKMQPMLTLFIGLCIAITALPVSIRILMDLGKLNSEIGQKIISAAIFNDVISLLILGIILDSKGSFTGFEDLFLSYLFTIVKVGIFVLIIILAFRGVHNLVQKSPFIGKRIDLLVDFLKGKESLFAMVILFILVFASISEILGLHFIIGAFFGAMLLNKGILGEENFEKIKSNTSGLTMGFLAPVFFASMGVQFNILAINDIMLLSMILLASFASKILGGYLGGRWAGMSKRESYTLGIGLNARGIMELVIANIALQNAFIDTSLYSILVLMGVITTLVSPYFLKRSFLLLDKQIAARGQAL
jgi:Kef-type K+ transport system membrane component KefB